MKEMLKAGLKPVYNRGKQILYGTAGQLRKKGLLRGGNFEKLASYGGLHKGERCFLIGTGPSLKAADLDLLLREKSIGCNMLYKLYGETKFRPTYYCMTDRVYARYQSEEMLRHVTAPIFVPKSTYERMPQKNERVIYVDDIYDYRVYRPRAEMLSYCWLKASVMLFMLEMAVYMGFAEIYLLGVDCSNTYRADGHFTRNYADVQTTAAEKRRLEQDLKRGSLTPEEMWAHNYRRNIEAYEEIQKFAKEKGVRIYNATRGGNLEVFERVALEEISGIYEKACVPAQDGRMMSAGDGRGEDKKGRML